MSFELPPLPFAENALEPNISADTVRVHYRKHHAGYVKKLNELIVGTPYAKMDLPKIIVESSKHKGDEAIFNNAGQVWNHSFYWASLSPNTQPLPKGELLDAIELSFGSLSEFERTMTDMAKNLFGSGWVWLVKNHDKSLQLLPMKNAGNPLTEGLLPLLVCDVWEHAYYLDHKNEREKYVHNFWSCINWHFVAENFAAEKLNFNLKQYLTKAS